MGGKAKLQTAKPTETYNTKKHSPQHHGLDSPPMPRDSGFSVFVFSHG